MIDPADLVLLDEAMAVEWARKLGYQIAGATIRQWASRGHIGRYREERGVMYDAGQIRDYLARRAALLDP